jgi:hypothetical protein
MANGIDWFRWHHGSVNDPKFGLVAKKAGARVGDVITVWALILELASANQDRGLVGDIDDETTDFLLGAEDGTTARIRQAMEGRGLLEQGRVARWESRQPKREREDNTATERKRKQRERDAKDNQGEPGHDMSRQVTPRGEKRREELTSKASTPDGVDVAGDADDAPPADKKLECPHQEIIALYHEVLPQCPQVRDWTPARATQLRARWNEDTDRQNLDYWRRFFNYVATCDFLVGKGSGDRPFMADLEWLTKSSNFTKIRERKYE